MPETPQAPKAQATARKAGDSQLALATAIGPQLLIRLAALIRTGRTHDVGNQAFQRQLQDCLAILQKLLEVEQDIALAAASGYFYLNGVRIRASSSLLPVYHALMNELERRGIGGIRFTYGVSPAEVERFFQLFVAADEAGVAEQVLGDLQAANIHHISLIDRSEIADEEVTKSLEERGDTSSERGRAQRTFWRAVLGTRKIMLRVVQTGRPDLRHAKRLVQPFVDQIMNNEFSIVGLTALKDHDEYTYAHCVNVSILSVSMGHVLELERNALADLGVAALLHDVGKLTVPGEVLRKAAKLDEDEWRLMHRHPLEGVKMMFRMPGLSPLTIDAMRCCFEHHMNVNNTGYPRVKLDWNQSSMSRIVAMADCFDAMTAHRAYHERPFTPFEALHYLLGRARDSFDPAVRWALARTVGLYPPGTVMITSSGTAVLSVTPNPDDLSRPTCRVLVHPDGRVEPEENGTMWSPMPESEQVVRVLRPEDIEVSTAEYLAA